MMQRKNLKAVVSPHTKHTAAFELVTPMKAESWLKLNKDNRHIHQRNLNDIAAAILDDRWMVNGETVKFDWNGKLIDGQHRLDCIVQTQTTIECLVVRGLNPECYKTVDIGAKRTVGDTFSRAGIKNANAVASALRWYEALIAGKAQVGNVRMQPGQALDKQAALPGFDRSVALALNVRSLLPPGIAGSLHYLFAARNADAADKFFNDLHVGAGLAHNDPVLVLRNRLINRKNATRVFTKPEELCAMTIRAWNARIEKRPLVVLRGLLPDAAGNMLMPSIEG